MTLAEFKAWFDGFTEDMEGPPNAKQWERIKARVKETEVLAYRNLTSPFPEPPWTATAAQLGEFREWPSETA